MPEGVTAPGLAAVGTDGGRLQITDGAAADEDGIDDDGEERLNNGRQLRADQLSDDCPLVSFWQRREAQESGQNRHRRAA